MEVKDQDKPIEEGQDMPEPEQDESLEELDNNLIAPNEMFRLEDSTKGLKLEANSKLFSVKDLKDLCMEVYDKISKSNGKAKEKSYYG